MIRFIFTLAAIVMMASCSDDDSAGGNISNDNFFGTWKTTQVITGIDENGDEYNYNVEECDNFVLDPTLTTYSPDGTYQMVRACDPSDVIENNVFSYNNGILTRTFEGEGTKTYHLVRLSDSRIKMDYFTGSSFNNNTSYPDVIIEKQ